MSPVQSFTARPAATALISAAAVGTSLLWPAT